MPGDGGDSNGVHANLKISTFDPSEYRTNSTTAINRPPKREDTNRLQCQLSLTKGTPLPLRFNMDEHLIPFGEDANWLLRYCKVPLHTGTGRVERHGSPNQPGSEVFRKIRELVGQPEPANQNF